VETGRIVLALLNGAKPSEIESRILGPDSLELFDELVERADIVIENGIER